MDTGNYVTYYVGLFTIQITLATIIAAGILAWYQLTEKQVPKRSISKVIKPLTMVTYFVLSVAVVLATAVVTWGQLGSHDLFPTLNFRLTALGAEPWVTLVFITVTVLLVFYFFYILWKTQSLIDSTKYLKKLGDDMDYARVNDYLFHRYTYRPFEPMIFAVIRARKSKKEKADDKKKQQEYEVRLKEWEKRYSDTESVVDPFAPIIEYTRANVQSASADVERISLPLLADLLSKAVEHEDDESGYIAKYIDDVTDDMLEVLADGSVVVKKRYIDAIHAVALAYCNKGQHETMVTVAKNMHKFTRGVENEALKIYVIEKLESLVSRLKELTEGAKEWRDVYLPMEGLMLVGARVGEDYYHNIDELAPVTLIENNNGEIDDLTGVLGNFMYRMGDLHRKYPDAIPVIYFDSLYVLSTALQSAILRSSAFKQDLGLTRSRYEQTLSGTDFILYDHARTAINAKNEDLLRVSVYNFLKLLEKMVTLGLESYMLDSFDELVRLGILVATSDWAKDKTTYGGIAIIDEIIGKIVEFPDQEKLYERKSSIEHDSFDVMLTDSYKDFLSQIGW